MAIVARFVFLREIRRKAFWEYCNTINGEAEMQANERRCRRCHVARL